MRKKYCRATIDNLLSLYSQLADEVAMRMETGQIAGAPTNQYAVLEGREQIDTRPFELYFALQEFSILKQHLSVQPQPPEKALGIQNYHLWFEAIIQLWIAVSKNKALNRVRTAVTMDEICEGEKIVRHSTSSVDIASVVYQLKEFWRLLAWPDESTAMHLEAQFIDAACCTSLQYCDLIHQNLIDSGYYEQQGPFRISDELCVSVNNLEYVRRALSEFRNDEQQLLQQQQMPMQNLNQMQQTILSLDNMLENTILQLERTTERIMSRMAITMQAPMQKSVFHLVSFYFI
jgi:BAI1-associated protein 3